MVPSADGGESQGLNGGGKAQYLHEEHIFSQKMMDFEGILII